MRPQCTESCFSRTTYVVLRYGISGRIESRRTPLKDSGLTLKTVRREKAGALNVRSTAVQGRRKALCGNHNIIHMHGQQVLRVISGAFNLFTEYDTCRLGGVRED